MRQLQIRSRQINETLTLQLHEAHVFFVRMTEIQERVQRGEVNTDDSKPSLEHAIAAHEAAMAACQTLLAERAMMFESFSKDYK
jgi:hypothetical protein